MRIFLNTFLLVFVCSIYAQDNQLLNERYNVINALFAKVEVENYGQAELDEDFFPFLGLGVLISDGDLIDSLFGNCIDFENNKKYSYKDVLFQNEISKMRDQISLFDFYKTINHERISNKIKIVRDNKNIKPAITFPLIYNNKAVIYMTNKKNEETLYVLIKERNGWIVRCRKSLYLRIDD